MAQQGKMKENINKMYIHGCTRYTSKSKISSSIHVPLI